MRRGVIRERVVRVLLNNPAGNLTGYRVAKLAEGAYPWVHELLKKLEKEGVVKGTQVKDFRKLINLWKSWRTPVSSREYMLRNPLDVLKKTKLEYALTTYQAENVVQKYLFVSRVDLYIRHKDLKRWHTLFAKEGLVGKGNTRVLMADDQVFYGASEREGIIIVSMPQLVVDLMSEGGVCVEAAEMLLEKMERNVVPRM